MTPSTSPLAQPASWLDSLCAFVLLSLMLAYLAYATLLVRSPDTSGYLLKNEQRFSAVLAQAGDLDDRRIPDALYAGLCVPAAVYTALPLATRPSLAEYALALAREGVLDERGIAADKLQPLLARHGLASRVWTSRELEHFDFLGFAAQALDEGRVVFLGLDLAESLIAQLESVSGDKPDVSQLTREQLVIGEGHLVRLVSVERDASGRVSRFAVYDPNQPQGAWVPYARLQAAATAPKPGSYGKRILVVSRRALLEPTFL